MEASYVAPSMSILGSFGELTLANNKCGTTSDGLTPELQLVGSIVDIGTSSGCTPP